MKQSDDVPSTPPEKPLVNTTALYAVYVVTIINQTCMFIYLGQMPFQFKQKNVNPVTYGYFMSATSFLTLLISPVLGSIADKAGSRWVLILSNVSASAAHLTMALANNVPMLLISRSISILMDILPVSQMAVTDLVPSESRGRYLGKTMVMMSIGMIVGPTLGGTLANHLGSQGVLMLTWMAPLFACFICLTFIPASIKQNQNKSTDKKGGINWSRLSELFGKGEIPFLLIMRLLATLPGMIFMMNFPLAGINFFKFSPQQNGLVYSCLGIINMFNNWYALGWLGAHLTGDQLIRWTPALSIITYFLMSQTSSGWHLIGVLYMINITYAIMENQVMTRLTKSVDASDTSTMVGIGTALFRLSQTISPTLGGILMQHYGWPALGYMGFFISIIMASLSLLRR